MFSSIIFSSNLIFLCILLGIFYSLFLYFKQKNILNNWTLYFLSFLRFLLITFLALLLLEPVIKSTTKIFEKPIVVILQDSSKSIKKNILNELNNLSDELKDFEVYKYHFSDKIYDGFADINTGLYTNYSNALDDVYSRFLNKNLSSIVLATDGMYNKGSNPLYSDNSSIPIHVIGLGDTTILKDNRISNVKNNDIVFLGNSFISDIYIESDKFNGRSTVLKIEHKGNLLFQQDIIFTKDKEFIKIPVEIKALKMGVQSYTATLTSLDEETLTQNNVYNFFVDVINSKYKILLLHDNVHPDIASYVNVIDDNKNYAIDVIRTKDFKDNFFDYNLVVLHSLSKDSKDVLLSLSNYNIPLLIFCKQDYNFYSSLMPNIKFKEKSSNNEVYTIVNADFNSFKTNKEFNQMILSSPPLFTSFGIYNISPSANLMLNERLGSLTTNSPVCVFDNVNNRKVGFLMGEGYWRWKLQDFNLHGNNKNFNALFNKITQFLLLRDDKSKFRVYYDKEINENDDFIIEAEVYNDSYELDNSNDIKLLITNKEDKEFMFLFDKFDNKYSLNIGVLSAGEYDFNATVDIKNYIKKGSLTVRPVQIESLRSVADHQILYNLSNQTNGGFYSKNNIDELVSLLNNTNNNKTIISVEDNLKQIIDFHWILLVLLLLISIEWFVRKFNGLI